MARGLDMAFLAAVAVAALIHSSAALSNYTVGDTTGWTIPPTGSGSGFYTTWAANKTFSVGDTLVFNFVAGAHDVARVTKADYDACTSTSPISVITTPPARIPINASGEHYFLCNFPSHCSSGQKLMINVSDASPSPSPSPSPAPQTSSPTPQPSTPAPQPSTPAPQPSTPPPQSSPAPQPSTPTPSSSPSPASTPPPTPASSPSPASTPPPTPASSPSPPPPASSPSPPPPPATTPPPAPPPNSATSLGLAGFTTFLSIFVALCY